MALDDTAIVKDVATLQAYPGMSALTTAQAEALINRASSRIRRITGRQYLIDDDASKTLYLDGDGSRDLVLPDGPVTVLTSVYDDPERDFDSGEIDLDDIMIYGGYRGPTYKDDHKDPPISRLSTYGAEGFSNARQNVRVIGKFGYGDTGDFYLIPEDLILACLMLCKHFHLHSDAGMMAERTQTYSYQKAGAKELIAGIPIEVASIIAQYSRWEAY